jgi:ribosomal protein L1
MAEVTQQDILSRIASGEGWTPLQDVAPTTPDVAALVPLVQEGRVEYRRDKESRIEYLRLKQ